MESVRNNLRKRCHGYLLSAEKELTEGWSGDCDGTVRKMSSCPLLTWVADDLDHRLIPGDPAAILEKAAPILSGGDVEVEIEYEDCQTSQFSMENVSVQGDELKFQLDTKHTDRLAKDACLPNGIGERGCC